MPELPEVETVVRAIRAPLIGRTIHSVWNDWPRIIHDTPPEAFAARIQGQTFRAIDRRAKFICCQLDHDTLLIHLKMTGRLYVVPADSEQEADRWVHVRFDLDDGFQLRFSDARKFGRVYLTDNVEQFTGQLGPEPLDDSFTPDMFQAQLAGRKKAIKAALLDQTIIAGVGNIYADESLFRARIHPQRRANTLNDDEMQRLYDAVRAALNAGIDHEGASINWYRKPDGTRGESQNHFYVYGRAGEPCQRCGRLIEKNRVAQRGTHFCAHCQPFTSEEV